MIESLEKRIQPLIYGFNAKYWQHKWIDVCIFLDPEAYSLLNIYHYDGKETKYLSQFDIYEIDQVHSNTLDM